MSKESQTQRKRFQNFITSERKQKRSNRGNSENDGNGNNNSNPIDNLFSVSNSGSSNTIGSNNPIGSSNPISSGSSNPISSSSPVVIKKWVPNEKIEGIRNIINLLNVNFLNKFFVTYIGRLGEIERKVDLLMKYAEEASEKFEKLSEELNKIKSSVDLILNRIMTEEVDEKFIKVRIFL
jgi:hypothetical protein